MDIKQRIQQQVTGAPVVLYMKGTPQAPQCGFSALAVQMLNACGVNEFASFNVLADAEIRQGVKEYPNWPTPPQPYIHATSARAPHPHPRKHPPAQPPH